MFSRCTFAFAIYLCGLSHLAVAANPLAAYPAAKPGDVGYVAEDPQLAQLVGRPAPNITLRSINGGTIDIVKNYGHKPVFLKVWATYCIPCRAQMPGFEKIYQRYGTKMQVVAVNAGIGDEPRKVRKFVAEANMHMPVAIDDGSLVGWLKLDSTPFHLLIGMDGRPTPDTRTVHSWMQRSSACSPASGRRASKPRMFKLWRHSGRVTLCLLSICAAPTIRRSDSYGKGGPGPCCSRQHGARVISEASSRRPLKPAVARANRRTRFPKMARSNGWEL
jgi:thiol-disulfide isomerase/thioredoxin